MSSRTRARGSPTGATPVQRKKKNRPIRARGELAPRQLDLERQTPGEADSQSDRSSSPEPTVSWSDPTPLEVDIVWTGSVYHYVDSKLPVLTTALRHIRCTVTSTQGRVQDAFIKESTEISTPCSIQLLKYCNLDVSCIMKFWIFDVFSQMFAHKCLSIYLFYY